MCHFSGRFRMALNMQVEVARVYVGTFMTSLDMAGFSLTVLVLDDERTAALDADTRVGCFNLWHCSRADAVEPVRACLVQLISEAVWLVRQMCE